MSLTTHSMYQKHILRCLNFSPAAAGKRVSAIFSNAPGAYILSVADYHIPQVRFPLAFRATGRRLRFGSLYEGATHYQLDGCRAGSSSPVHFLVREQGIRGKQSWQRGDHCRGIELALSQPYLDSLKPLAAQLSLLDRASCQCHPKCAPACCCYALARNGGTGRHTNALAAAPGGNGAAMSGRIGRGGGRNLFLTAGPSTHPCPWQAAAVVFGGGPPGHPPGAPSHHRASRSQSHHRLFKPPRSTSMNKN